MSCPDCFTGAIRKGNPLGKEEVIYGVRTYIAGPASAQDPALSTIIFITDAFGFNLVNSKLLADTYATKTGFRVLVPDIIPGGGVPVHSLELMNSVQAPCAWNDFIGQLRRLFNIARMVSIFLPFAIRTRNAYPGILGFVRDVKKDMSSQQKLGAAGFCWGALQTTKLARESATEQGDAQLIDAHYIAHPSGIKVPEDIITSIEKYRVPCSIALGETDTLLPKEKAEELEARLRVEFADKQGPDYEIKVYQKCGHGFAIRADASKPVEDQASEEAANQASSWFKQHLTR